MPGVDYAPDPTIDHVAPDHRDEGRVGNIRTAAQIEADAGRELQRDREAVGRGDREAMPPTGNPAPKVVDSDPEAGPDVKPGGVKVLDFVPDHDHEIEVLEKEQAAIAARLGDLRRRKQDLEARAPQTSSEQRLTGEQKRAIDAETSLEKTRTETERADERIRQRAANEEGGPSVFPDRTRSAEEQDTARRHGDEGLFPHRPRLAEEQTPSGRPVRGDERSERPQPAEPAGPGGKAEEGGKPEVPGDTRPGGKRETGKKQ